MKKIILSALLLVSINAIAQDSTKVKGLQLQARLIEYLTVNLLVPDNDSLFQVYQDLRPKFRVTNPPNGNTLVTIDSVPTYELARLYNYTLSNSEGIGVAAQMKAQITASRLTNTYLERLCAEFEKAWQDKYLSLRIAGRKLLKGK